MIHSLVDAARWWMRGSDKRSGSLFSYVDLEARVRGDHPLRRIRAFADTALGALSDDFARLYSGMGRPSIAPEMLLQAFYSIRSERQLMERLEFDLLFRWFVGLGIDDAAWDHSTFSKNRDRLSDGEIAAKFLAAVLAQPKVKRLLSTDHFSVDGTLIEAWASTKTISPSSRRPGSWRLTSGSRGGRRVTPPGPPRPRSPRGWGKGGEAARRSATPSRRWWPTSRTAPRGGFGGVLAHDRPGGGVFLHHSRGLEGAGVPAGGPQPQPGRRDPHPAGVLGRG
jgi:transposase